MMIFRNIILIVNTLILVSEYILYRDMRSAMEYARKTFFAEMSDIEDMEQSSSIRMAVCCELLIISMLSISLAAQSNLNKGNNIIISILIVVGILLTILVSAILLIYKEDLSDIQSKMMSNTLKNIKG